MKIALDLNIIIDLALRQKAFPESAQAYVKLLLDGQQLGLPLCGYTTLFYLLNRGLGKKDSAGSRHERKSRAPYYGNRYIRSISLLSQSSLFIPDTYLLRPHPGV